MGHLSISLSGIYLSVSPLRRLTTGWKRIGGASLAKMADERIVFGVPAEELFFPGTSRLKPTGRSRRPSEEPQKTELARSEGGRTAGEVNTPFLEDG